MNIYCKKTTELTDHELIMMTQLFEQVFERSSSVANMKSLYSLNTLGYSFHSIIEADGIIVGLNSYNPAYYNYYGEEMLFVNSMTSMVAKSYRDFFNFYEMVLAAYEYMKAEGVSFVFGYPNHNSYPVLKKSKLMTEIGPMSIYCLPYRLGGIKSSLSFLNFFTAIGCTAFVTLSALFASKKILKYKIEKDIESFNKTRYKRSDGYVIVNEASFSFVYRIQEYNKIKTGFLVDVFPKSSSNFNQAVRYMLKKSGKYFDLVLYVGDVKAKGIGLIKIPSKYEPKKFNFMGKSLDNGKITENIWNIKNWDTNLSNFDLI